MTSGAERSVQAFRGAKRGRANVDFDHLYFDCRSRLFDHLIGAGERQHRFINQ